MAEHRSQMPFRFRMAKKGVEPVRPFDVTEDPMTSHPLPEPHYTARTLAESWCLDVSTILDWFSEIPGVLKLQPKKPRNGARTRCEIRIPHSVAVRVYRERTK